MKPMHVCAVCFVFIILFSGICLCSSDLQILEKFWIDQGNSQLSKGIQDTSREQCEKAAKSYQLAIDINSTSAELWRAKSLSLFMAKKYNDAEISIDKAIVLDPNSAPSWSTKCLILFSEDRLNESLSCINRAVELNSSDAALWVTKGLILSEMNQYEDSFDCFDNATQINPSFAPGWLLKGMMYDVLKRYDEALICYDAAIEVDPYSAVAYFYKGNMLASLEKYDEAKECWTAAIDIDPNYKILEKEMPIFPKSTQTRLVILSIWIDNTTREILENLDFLVKRPVFGRCNVTNKSEIDIRNRSPITIIGEPSTILSPGQKGPATGIDMFAEIKKEIEASNKSLCTVPNFTNTVLFVNCFTVCAHTSCSSEGNDTLSCTDCEGINTDVAVYVNNGIVVGLAIRFHPNFWSDIQELSKNASKSWMGWLSSGEENDAHRQYLSNVTVPGQERWNDYQNPLEEARANKTEINYSQNQIIWSGVTDADLAKAAVWVGKGKALYSQGAYSDAINAYDEAILLNPKDADAWNDKGEALKALGNIIEADAAFAKAKELGYGG